MNLLDKFNAVEVKADSRISAEDRRFCETHQEAYDKARDALKDIARKVAAYREEELGILSSVKDSGYTDYFNMEPSKCTDMLDNSHGHFICTIVNHFISKYNVELDAEAVKGLLVPKQPSYNRWNTESQEAHERYMEKLRSLALRYEDVLDQIFIQLGGCSFQDKALHEMKDRCHVAAWSTYNGKKKYEQKKAVLSFSGYFCHWDTWYCEPHIELSDGMKHIIQALSYFESGAIKDVIHELADLVGFRFCVPEFEVDRTKIKSVKCFKNGRVDIRFQSEAYAREFAETFLGTEAA